MFCFTTQCNQNKTFEKPLRSVIRSFEWLEIPEISYKQFLLLCTSENILTQSATPNYFLSLGSMSHIIVRLGIVHCISCGVQKLLHFPKYIVSKSMMLFSFIKNHQNLIKQFSHLIITNLFFCKNFKCELYFYLRAF